LVTAPRFGAPSGVGLQSNSISDKSRRHAVYAVKFYAYIFVANVLAFVIVARWLHPFSFVASLAFGLVFADLTFVTGRWLKRRISSARGLLRTND
jgi:hypothetical protein